ncbi:MAG: enoyl-CoA hydratase/isomerase family protein [Syntrophomonadaceae bacterium]|nr:enoyl-CoA hydratase/isomerase family protein [Syntrophomonadaceae bacterium]
MAIVEWKKDGTVAIMTMNNGENRHNPTWSAKMLEVYNEIIADETVTALVLTSSDPKNFCLGVDLEWLSGPLAEKNWPVFTDWLYQNTEVFKAFIMAPIPTIAAITGHAFGNGAMLAGACDFRFMRADRGYFCLPEIDLGIQFAPSMMEWMRRIMPYHFFQKMLLTGDRVAAPELEQHHVILKACENAEKTLEEAVAFARTFNKTRKNMQEMKNRAYKHVLDKMEFDDPQYFEVDPHAEAEGRLPVFMLTV